MSHRLPAEWEPQSAIQFTFPHEDSDWLPMLDEVIPCFVRLIETVTKYEKALVVCKNKAQTAELLRGAVQTNLILVDLPSNDTWARDHGAITVFDGAQPVLLDFVFNGWGLKFAADKDNLITQRLFDKGVFKTKKIKKGGLALEGGGIESDGKGTLMTTAECLLSPNRNPHLSKRQIEQRLKRLFGVKRILWLENGYLAGDDTDSHIDTLARFCDAETIAYVRCSDPNDEHYGALQRMENELLAFRTVEERNPDTIGEGGQPYKLVALPMSDAIFDEDGQRLPATYANFLIMNGAVLVPTYDVPQDAEALEILRGCFPDREVIGLDCRPLIFQHGSLHCVTMQLPENII